MLKNVMIRAHKIAAGLEGDYQARLSMALRLAWQEVRNLRKLGSEWKKNGMHRIYFNSLSTWYGLECDCYKTGSISYAELNGGRISNTQARKIEVRFLSAKVYYDVSTGKFMGQNIASDDLSTIVRAIRTAAQAA